MRCPAAHPGRDGGTGVYRCVLPRGHQPHSGYGHHVTVDGNGNRCVWTRAPHVVIDDGGSRAYLHTVVDDEFCLITRKDRVEGVVLFYAVPTITIRRAARFPPPWVWEFPRFPRRREEDTEEDTEEED